jgi:chromosome segregation ATPase
MIGMEELLQQIIERLSRIEENQERMENNQERMENNQAEFRAEVNKKLNVLTETVARNSEQESRINDLSDRLTNVEVDVILIKKAVSIQ